MRRAAKVDANQHEIVRGLRDIGCTVISLAAVGKGCPDILVGRMAKNYLLEIKDGTKAASRRQLSVDQKEFFSNWRGQVRVVTTLEEAIKVVTESYR